MHPGWGRRGEKNTFTRPYMEVEPLILGKSCQTGSSLLNLEQLHVEGELGVGGNRTAGGAGRAVGELHGGSGKGGAAKACECDSRDLGMPGGHALDPPLWSIFPDKLSLARSLARSLAVWSAVVSKSRCPDARI